MPIYEFLCEDYHVTEKWWHLASESKDEVLCDCGKVARRVISMPTVHFPEIDPESGLKVFRGNPWEGTPLEDSDGINRLRYKSDKVQVDLGK
jgi:hypothetical protein